MVKYANCAGDCFDSLLPTPLVGCNRTCNRRRGNILGEENFCCSLKLGLRNDSVVVLKALKESTLKTPKSPHLFLSKLCVCVFFSPGLRINNSAERQEEVNHSCTFSIPFQPGML